MILAVDPGLATCGWAVVTPLARVQALGVITTAPDKSVAKSADRARRAAHLARELLGVADRHACSLVAAEAMSFPRGIDGIAAIALCWGVITGLAHARGCTLLEVEPKVWQRAVLPGSGRKVDYDELASKLEVFAVDVADLRRIKPALRTHALDALAIGVYAAVARGRGEVVIAESAPHATLQESHG